MIDIDNRTSLKIDESLLNTIATKLTDKDIELLIVDEEEMKNINKLHRNIEKSTDVLSFPYEEMPMSPLGSIVISSFHIETLANKLGHTNNDELNLLFIHGILHLLAYDHEVDNGEMKEEEERLINEFNLPKSLITRIQG
ncbi:rRNA maturation RNase YbeY [Sulfurimonas sp.]|uniref:rRNA maturation RNase YbeY n=1 Tax=Sulfurimonas sp. TaxID=2022749 RepID=UPI002AB09D92|nr:rRNA maturation RNase YbeY [Sulfurimonas sp.]